MSNHPSAPTIAKGVLAVTWPFLSIIVFLVLLSFFSMDTLSAARAFVGGESLWTKGQKAAVQQLEQYVETGAPRYYAGYLEAVAVPLGDHAARLELEKRNPDQRLIDAGFARGGNHPGDFGSMTRLFRRFHAYGPVAEAIDIWRDADTRLAELTVIAERIHQSMERGDLGQAGIELDRLRAVDATLTPLEKHFSEALGEASRQAENLLRLVTLLSAALLAAAGFVGARRVVASERRMAASLEFNEARQKLAIMASRHGIWDMDVERASMHITPSFMAALGYPDWPEQVPLANVLELLDPTDRAAFERHVLDTAAPDTGGESEYRLRAANGQTRWIRVQGGAMRDARGHCIRVAGAMRDISEQKLAETELFELKALALVTLQSIREAVVTTDAEGHIDYMNPSAEDLLRTHQEAIHGAPATRLCRFIDEASRQDVPNPVERALAEARPVELATHTAVVLGDGTEIPVDASSSLMRNQDGSTFGAVLVLRDARQERATAAQIIYQATHDPLTGLINRNEFERRIASAMEQCRRDAAPQALMFLDLDQFKIVNDTCGHAAGDELLRQVSRLMVASLRTGDTLARLGGDEFGVLAHGCTLRQTIRVAEKLREQVSQFRFCADGRVFSIGLSIGVVALGKDFDDPPAAMRAADAACYLAKEKGRDRVQVYRSSDVELNRRQGMMQWIARIREALEQDAFRLYAQAIEPTTPRTDAPLHFEVLLRLREPSGDLVPPSLFLPAAERYGLVTAVDRWVVSASFHALRQAGMRAPALCSINLSAASLGDERFAEQILALGEACGIAPECVCFEVTETAVISEVGKARKFIQRLRSRGFRFALDDFGSGMASFGYLKHLPVDYLKIDGAFVKQMLSDRADRAMVDSINQIGKVFGIPVIAEFVEDDATRTLLGQMGVDHVQGYGVGLPLPLEQLLSGKSVTACHVRTPSTRKGRRRQDQRADATGP